jgi:hypothetical protein
MPNFIIKISGLLLQKGGFAVLAVKASLLKALTVSSKASEQLKSTVVKSSLIFKTLKTLLELRSLFAAPQL